MSHFPPNSYSQSSYTGWTFDVQGEVSLSSNTADVWPHSNNQGFPLIDPFDNLLNSYYDSPIPISRYSTLAGALTPVNHTQLGGEHQPVQPAPQSEVQHQLVQPVLPQLAGPAPQQLAQPTHIQPAQPVPPQLVAPIYLGVQNQNVAPPPITSTRRRAYVLTNPPARHRREPGAIQFCRVGGCKWWTDDRGKKLSRHRQSHFHERAGVACPVCNRVFARSDSCGDHLKREHPRTWNNIAAKKGTQDAWGKIVGKDLINASLVDGQYTPLAMYRL